MFRSSKSALALLLLFLTACAGPRGAFSAGSVLRNVDNDALSRSDDQYSSGLSLAYLSEPATSFEDLPVPGGLARALEGAWSLDADEQRFVVYSLAHRIFTPTDLSATEVVEDDLPYTALLYGTATFGAQSRDELNALSMTLGVTGPLALGEAVQSSIHGVIGSTDPRGWDNQLESEPLIGIGLEHRRRLARVGSTGGFGADLLGGLSASLGNLQTQATAAATLRFGWEVPSNFHMQAPFLADESLGLRAYDPCECEHSVYGFAGVAATGLAHAVYLDGNLFSDSHSVEHDNYVVRGSFGLAAELGDVLATLSYERASVPWEHPDGLDEETFLRLGLSWNF